MTGHGHASGRPRPSFGPTRRRAWTAGFVAALLMVLVAPSAGSAATPLPVREANGVKVLRERGAIVVVFTKRAAKLYRRVAGKRIAIYCTELVPPDASGFGGSNTGGSTFRAPKRRRAIHTGDLTRGLDYCRVWLAARTVKRRGRRVRLSRELIVSVPLTQTGAVHLDEESKSSTLFSLLLIARLSGSDRKAYPTPAQLIEAVRRRGGSSRSGIVALAAPTDTPPGGSIGYYSDGRAHAAAVIVSASGRRLFIELESDVLHTNVAGYIYGDRD